MDEKPKKPKKPDLFNRIDSEDASARNSDPQTSHDAANHMNKTGATSRLERLTVAVLDAEYRRMTVTEIAGDCGKPLWSISPRMAPLERKGLVRRDGTKPCRNSSDNIRELTAWVSTKWDKREGGTDVTPDPAPSPVSANEN